MVVSIVVRPLWIWAHLRDSRKAEDVVLDDRVVTDAVGAEVVVEMVAEVEAEDLSCVGRVSSQGMCVGSARTASRVSRKTDKAAC